MEKRYRCYRLSRRDEELMQLMLLEELELQTWFGIVYNWMMSEEFIVCLQ